LQLNCAGAAAQLSSFKGFGTVNFILANPAIFIWMNLRLALFVWIFICGFVGQTVSPPANEAPAPRVFRVRIETSAGNLVIEAHRDWAPLGVDRFHRLALIGFFNDSRFFRVVPGFVAQFGIAGKPEVARTWRYKTIADDPVIKSNQRGLVSYAMTGPNARTTQLFINLADNSRLDAQGFAPIGQVVEGMEVVDKLYSGYGETSDGGMRAGKQAKLFEEGNAWLDRDFPKLDKLLRAVIDAPQR
jgi:cyclophilin family peptidyl-prolyl cis-trans isomerase